MAVEDSQFLGRIANYLADWLIQHRTVLLILFIGITIFLGYHAAAIRLDAGFEKSVPTNHEYMQTYAEYAPLFGGANSVTVALIKREGDIFNPEFMTTLDEATRDVLAIKGVDQPTVASLFTPTAVFITVNEVGFAGGRIVPGDFKPNAESIAEVRQNLLKSNEVGRLTSKDFSGALIRMELVERDPVTLERLDYQRIGRDLDELLEKYQSDDLDVHIIGFAPFIYDVIAGARSVLIFFGVAFLITGALLLLYSGSASITAVALFVALDAVIWQLGLVELLGYGIDPLSILVPFLIFSIGVSHAVQMTNTWRIAATESSDSVEAARVSFRKLFIPGATALLANAAGFGVIMLIDIPIIHELGITASIGVAVMIITNKFLLPVLLTYLKPPASKADNFASRLQYHRLWDLISRCAERRVSIPILVIAILILGYGVSARDDLIVGDTDAGAPELRPGARYNRDVDAIVSNFNIGIDELTVVATLGKECVDFPSLYAVDRYSTQIEQLPGVKSVNSLARQVRVRNIGNTEGNPKFFEIPRYASSIGGAMRNMEIGLKLFDSKCSAMPIRIFTEDHRAQTLETIVEQTKQYRRENDVEQVDFLLAAGNNGVMAATNEAVQEARDRMLIALYLAVGLLCFATFGSWRITICVLIPLIFVSQFAEAVMAWLGIGLKVSTLPIVALGAGVGVDYGIYLFSRTQTALREGLSLKSAYLQGLQQAGTAVAFTAITMTIGVATWIFSPLKFQADMGLLLSYMFFVNMLGALVVLPALAAWLVSAKKPEEPALN